MSSSYFFLGTVVVLLIIGLSGVQFGEKSGICGWFEIMSVITPELYDTKSSVLNQYEVVQIGYLCDYVPNARQWGTQGIFHCKPL